MLTMRPRSSFFLVALLAPALSVSCGQSNDAAAPDLAVSGAQGDAGATQSPSPKISLQVTRVRSPELGENVNAYCPAGTTVIGGGCDCNDLSMNVWKSMPVPDKEAWNCQAMHTPTTPQPARVTAYAICIGAQADNATVTVGQLPQNP